MNLYKSIHEFESLDPIDKIGLESFADAVKENTILSTYNDYEPAGDGLVLFKGDLSNQLYKFVLTDTGWEAYKISDDGIQQGDAFPFITFK